MSTITTPPTVQKVLEIDGPYADERELLLAAFADGLSEKACRTLVSIIMDEIGKELDEQAQAEIRAENAWLHAAENSGWDDDPRSY